MGKEKDPKIQCNWCDEDAVWVVVGNGIKNDYMCDHHYNSHARSPLSKGKLLPKPLQ